MLRDLEGDLLEEFPHRPHVATVYMSVEPRTAFPALSLAAVLSSPTASSTLAVYYLCASITLFLTISIHGL